jgi:hypothetical protein
MTRKKCSSPLFLLRQKERKRNQKTRRKRRDPNSNNDEEKNSEEEKSMTFLQTVKFYSWQKHYRRYIFLIPGFVCTAVLQKICDVEFSFRYNSLLLLILAGSIAFPSYPQNSIRFQLCLSVVLLHSIGIDLTNLFWSFAFVSSSIFTLKIFALLCKLGLFATFLLTTN